jgi:hypothetical protein
VKTTHALVDDLYSQTVSSTGSDNPFSFAVAFVDVGDELVI